MWLNIKPTSRQCLVYAGLAFKELWLVLDPYGSAWRWTINNFMPTTLYAAALET